MSAPPIAAVVVMPLMKLSIVFAPRNPAATMGTDGAIVTKAPIVAMFVARRVEFTKCFAGIDNGREDTRPASLRNATIEPVNVMPPAKMTVRAEMQMSNQRTNQSRLRGKR